jgi:hypothetical protein
LAEIITKELDLNSLMRSLDQKEIPSEQDFGEGSTTWFFPEGSKIKIMGVDVVVKDR